MNFKVFDNLCDDSKNIRIMVFVEEQKFEVEFDEFDGISKHIVLYLGDKCIATSRIYKEDDLYVIGRIAVVKEYRKLGYGKKIILFSEELIKELGGNKIKISAQSRVKEFYEKLGYVTYGDEYYDEYCPHVGMIKVL